jgi:hypothetical protein
MQLSMTLKEMESQIKKLMEVLTGFSETEARAKRIFNRVEIGQSPD